MESREGVAALYSSSSSSTGGGGADGTFAKRQRTKRLRALSSSPPPLAPPPPREDQDYSSTTTATEEEEEDTAHCLILLAQGRALGEVDSRKLAETTPTAAKAGFNGVYECKTCNRRFPSFQALGGHRTSHKKPRPAAAASPDRDGPETTSTSSSASLVVVPAAADVSKSCRSHECSICGSEFASGQALGGHMRRHRPPQGPTAAPSSSPAPEEKSVLLLSLDLNLPAPSEGDVSRNNSSMAAVAFADRLPLVDCHY